MPTYPTRRISRIQSRRASRIDTAISSLASTFARTGAAYLDGVSYAANTARFPNTAGTVGVLVEEGTTNLVLQSNAPQTAPWSSASFTVTANADVAPDGTTTAAQFVSTALTHFEYQQVTVTASTTYTFSFYAKNNGGIKAAYSIYDATGAANIIAPTSYFSKLSSTGYTRVSVTFTTPAGCTAIRTYMLRDSLSAGDPTNGVNLFLWGAQLEQKGYATTLVPTSGATATRNAETLTIPTAGILRPDRGAVIVRFYADGDLAAATRAAYHVPFAHANASPNNVISCQIAPSTNTLRLQTTNAAGASTIATSSAVVLSGWNILGFRWRAPSLDIFLNGVRVATATNPNLPASLGASARIGSQHDGTLQMDSPIAYEVLYDRDPSDAEMAAATKGYLPPGYTAKLDFTKGRAQAVTGAPYRTGEWLAMGIDPRDAL